MKVEVDEIHCQGHGLCQMTSPDVFGLRDEDGHSYVLPDGANPTHEKSARQAAAACPERAITVTSD
ncbi:ferredoxin [Rhodococcus marinonascens]|uniref:ferredoxin n=1 Tax=Rhodococcus marinonascens TaxID=38311 RepID=UPI000934B8F1|nr:ferredoxin [Rhodococcus marinonascens]